MKIKPEMDPSAAFPDVKHQPDEAELHAALDLAAAPLEAVVAKLRATQTDIAAAWQFSARVGWYRIHLLKKRRLFYLVPKRGDFRVSLILGGKAIAELKSGPFARCTVRLLKTAKRYPEGIAFSFERKSFDPELVLAFVEAKIAH